MVKVSIIVALYNLEKYARRCFNSLINQTLKDIEIIIIDDGSTDSSLEIAKEYEKKDKRVKVISQENSKQGSARNRGLEIAQGEFITFVDSDDWINEDYCELLYNAVQKHNVNIAIASVIREYPHKSKEFLKLTEEKVVYDPNSIIKTVKRNFLMTCGKLYRFENIKNLRFEENMIFEDPPYTIQAIDFEKSLVCVPNAIYHYYSNPKSTLKQKLDPKKENDKIACALNVIKYAKEHNLDITNPCILKENHFFWKIKHYIDKKDFYIFGIKVFSKNIPFDNRKNIVVFNTACFGDVLLCNSLCQNIKAVFPDSNLIFVCDKNWQTVAKYQEGVDEVIVFDKKGEHKGFFGLLKFAKKFKNKKIYASFITYKNHRNIFASMLIKSRFILYQNKIKDTPKQIQHNILLKRLTHKKIINYPIKFNLPKNIINPIKEEKYIAICCVSKNTIKDMPLKTAEELIKYISKTEYKPVFTGAGKKAKEYSKKLKDSGCEFIDLTDKTSILELGEVLKNSKCLITIDTGTMHYGYSLGVKTLALFYEKGSKSTWSPDKTIYPYTQVIDKDLSTENIIKVLNKEFI